MTFKSSQDSLIRTLTIFAIVLMLVVASFVAITDLGFLRWLLPVFFVVLLVGAYLYAPSGRVELTQPGGDVRIGRRIGPVNLAHADIVSLRVMQQQDFGRVWRKAGVGGVFGIFGLMNSQHVGNFTLWATRRSPYVMAELRDGRKVAFSVDEPDAFVTQFKQQHV